MRVLLTILTLVVLGAVAALPARASAMDLTGSSMADTDHCSAMMDMSGDTMDMTTIESLRHHVVHMYDMGHITNAGVEAALLSLVDAAQAAADKGNTTAAINSLDAFIALVEKQPGTVVDLEHADCLVEHATMVVEALGG